MVKFEAHLAPKLQIGGAKQTTHSALYKVKWVFFKWVWFLGKFYKTNGNWKTQDHYWELSNEASTVCKFASKGIKAGSSQI